MSKYNLLKALLISLIITSVISACGEPFTIKDKKFKADDVCDAIEEVKIELKMENNKLVMKPLTEFHVYMRKTGMPSAWCHGIKNIWKGKTSYAGYTFDSSKDDPLQFKVDRNKGYYYLKGERTVTRPDGKVIKLP